MINSLISFVILTCNSQQTIIESIDSIISVMATNDIKDYEIFIVDNGSKDNTLNLLKKYDNDEHIKLIKLHTNKGTTFSRNRALRLTRGRYICIMDSDIMIRDLQWEHILCAFHEGIGLVVPRLYLPDGSIQHSVKKFPRFHWRLKKLLNIFLGLHVFDRELYPDLEKIRYPDVAISAFWVLRRKALNAVGLFDEKIFYSPEDVDYCVRLWEKGFAISYVREGNILHHTQQITHKNPVSFIAFTFFLNFIYYFLKHGYFFSTGKLDRRKAQVLRVLDTPSDKIV
jgi:GT2 family glycosyltransferase